ncbi:hypothetical protein [Hymenobacter sp. UYCo722]|uniref:hypothetical protein n=1 Tax=Hymenobacter sp. UYCo722 TaxID=3156335 RepID=UPI0033912982
METTEPNRSFLFDVLLPKLEVISWILAVIGFVANWFQLRNADYLLIIGLGGLADVYMLKALSPLQIAADDEQYLMANESGEHYSQIAPTDVRNSNFDTVRRQIIAFGSGAIFAGVLFRLMAWEYNTNILLFGEACLLVAILSLALKQHYSMRLLLLAALGGLTLYIPAETWIHQFHGNDPILVQKMIYQLDHPRDQAAAQDVREYLKQKRARR